MSYDLSIVTGTYNRHDHLIKMIEAARASIRYGLSYQFVIVDGGSIDNTIEWCKSQGDIKLIEHGKLMGAVKAFNDGAYAASGDYVILANDDIEFISDSIWQAYLHMQLNVNCGVGCFYQNRDGRNWHVETMPVVKDGKQASAYYGQVCIVPKWLGDMVGWWCDAERYKKLASDRNDKYIRPLHTYAGDNELSSRIYDLGFEIHPIDKAKIHDNTVEDQLRKLNNIRGGTDPRAVRGHHPDSWAWGRAWRNPRTELVGAEIKDRPRIENQTMIKPRILYLPIYEAGWDIQKEQKRGLRLALQKVGLCVEYDYVSKFNGLGRDKVMTELANIMQDIKPTLVLTQLHNGDMLGAKDITQLRKFANGAIFVNWNGDYWPDNLLSTDGIELAKAFDLMTSVNLDVVEKYQSMGINARFWQIGFEPEGRVDHATIAHDVVFLASGYSSARQKFGGWLKQLQGINLGLYGNGWPEGWSKGQNLYNFREAAGIYKGARIALGDSQWPNSGFVSNRVMQILAAGGCALCHQWFRGMENLGLIDGATCIIWRDYSELEHKMRYYLGNETERARIATNGEKLAMERHSFDSRVKELFEMIGLNEQEMIADDWRW